jgi:hypothetical protein
MEIMFFYIKTVTNRGFACYFRGTHANDEFFNVKIEKKYETIPQAC